MFEKILGKAKGIFNIITLIDLAIGLIYFLVGLTFFINPNLSNTLVSIITGMLLIFNGVISVVSFIKRDGIELYNYNLIYGIILIIIGIVAMFLGRILSIALGLYFIASGVQKINYGILLKRFHESSWLTILIVGVLFIILGVTAFFTSGDAVITVTGICLSGYGVMSIVDTILLRRRSEYFIA